MSQSILYLTRIFLGIYIIVGTRRGGEGRRWEEEKGDKVQKKGGRSEKGEGKKGEGGRNEGKRGRTYSRQEEIT